MASRMSLAKKLKQAGLTEAELRKLLRISRKNFSKKKMEKALDALMIVGSSNFGDGNKDLLSGVAIDDADEYRQQLRPVAGG